MEAVEQRDGIGPEDVNEVITALTGGIPSFTSQLDRAIAHGPEAQAELTRSIAEKQELRDLITRVGPDGERIAQLVYEFVAGIRR